MTGMGLYGYGYRYGDGYVNMYPYPYPAYPYPCTCRIYPYRCPSLAVMVIEVQLCQLCCPPSHGGVRILEFINTWHTTLSQMEATGFLPGIRQLLSTFADGLPNNTVAFVNHYDLIILSLNEPFEHLFPNIHHLFDHTTQIDNNIQCTRILHPNPCRLLSTTSTTAPPTPPNPTTGSSVTILQGD